MGRQSVNQPTSLPSLRGVVPAKPLGDGRGKHREGWGVGDKAALFFPKLPGDGTGNRPSLRSSCVRFLCSSLAITDSTQERLYAKPPICRIPQAGPSAMGPAVSPSSRPTARFTEYNRAL